MAKFLKYALIIVVGGTIGGVALNKYNTQSSTPITSQFSVTATEMKRDFIANEVAANKKYEVPFKVTGAVLAVKSGLVSGSTIHLGPGKGLGLIMADVSEDDALKVKAGAMVTLICKSGFQAVGTPVLSGCHVVN